MKNGVDISEMNGTVDFSALKSSDVEFVIIRTGYGSDYPGQQDKRFRENVAKAEAAGMPWGAYHYSYARDAAAGLAEAEHAKRILDGKVPPYGLWLDMEDNKTLGGNLAAAAETFCMAFESLGVYVGIYASANWWKNYLTSPVFNRWDKWVAQYNTSLEYGTPGENVGIWQYTDKLVIGGKNFDGNHAYRDYPAITGIEEDDEMFTYDKFKEYMARYEAEKAEKPVPDWAKDAVDYVITCGYMNGYPDGSFHAQSNMTRAEYAQAVYNMRKDAKS